MLLGSAATYAQATDKPVTDVAKTPYQSAMDGLLTKMKAANTAEAFEAVANGFDRIAQKETTKWHPKYYAAFNIIMQTMMTKDKTPELDAMLDKAEALLDEATKLTKKQDEILTMKAFLNSARIGVEPMKRGMQYGPKTIQLLAEAEKLNPSNPRVYYMRGQQFFYTPKEFGGGKEKAKAQFEQASMYFQREREGKKMEQYDPSWGEDQCKSMLAECAK